MRQCGRSYGIFSRAVTSAGSDTPNNDNRPSNSYFDSVLNTIFEKKTTSKEIQAC